MGIYRRHILPRLVHVACSGRPVMRQREKVVPAARGRVLEVGFGSGLNLPHYDPESVGHLWALEPSTEAWRMARRRVARVAFAVEHVPAVAESIPLDDDSVDTIVLTYTLCTVAEVTRALAEMLRVLRPTGRLVFTEHGAAPDPGVRRWQDRLNPLWTRAGGGCNLNRENPRLITEAGFTVNVLEAMYVPGWRPVSYHYWGTAVAGPRETAAP